MRRTIRGHDAVGALAAVAVAGVVLYIGGRRGIVIVEGAAALVVVIILLRSLSEGGNGDAG